MRLPPALFALSLVQGALAACSRPAPPAPPPPEAETRFRALETGSALEAMEAAEKLRASWDDALLPRLERILVGPPRSTMRALQLLAELESPGSQSLLEARLPALLESGERDVARQAAVAAGLRKVRPATLALLSYFDRTDEKAALRALGRIWERKPGDPALPRGAEIQRLGVLQLTHRLAMGPSTTPEACEAMLRVMTREELGDFLSKHAADKFYARGLIDEAVRKKGFDPEKGARVHEAFLASPDLDLVAGVLESSPHPLSADVVRRALEDRRAAREGLRVCDLAATRLSGKRPATPEGRDDLIRSLKK